MIDSANTSRTVAGRRDVGVCAVVVAINRRLAATPGSASEAEATRIAQSPDALPGVAANDRRLSRQIRASREILRRETAMRRIFLAVVTCGIGSLGLVAQGQPLTPFGGLRPIEPGYPVPLPVPIGVSPLVPIPDLPPSSDVKPSTSIGPGTTTGGPAAAVAAEESDAESLAERQFPGGAPLRTDPELESMMRQAEKFVTAGRIDLACLRWQQILEQARDVVASRDGRFYQPLSQDIERRITSLSADGVRQYRLQVDGKVAAILAGDSSPVVAPPVIAPPTGDDEETAPAPVVPTRLTREDRLVDVVRRYFASSYGDDAAFELASRALDRGEAATASRLLERIVTEYPDSDLPRGEVLLRLAVARALLGDEAGAAGRLADLRPTDLPTDPERLAAVGAWVASRADGATHRPGGTGLAAADTDHAGTTGPQGNPPTLGSQFCHRSWPSRRNCRWVCPPPPVAAFKLSRSVNAG